ncbi:biotin carboxyl carrier protein [Clostridium tetanomorphum]|uniref:Acetyl-CoA carboxylase biotin carboxyl carrier protein subunit n=1 Tax=Clostridium tetanomorphum TaxID=1553 RepID=A0A923EBH4_CLOTT|nr:acetyl-CoA carboxylase biotin carboxyl carrier protein subunit [Clostridium tetanomorphum]KAJ49407.1 biotin/lipoyl attachment domain-containing protein [Clostridium tetanomorphum DSM 665]KAJ52744.1 biotin/lipoyl attachment domain-containing protein [Clostridium tetanomorphum DSM 665]MBC2400033.1 acetyl-CoA carboxylase biotin carboxyl carrier protein subunit [Clostridium tetanomorphum]MBP1866481.1 biotin carboxyl carrier protein [Clostridium tetanomorphum]NRS86397.1 biotin carboxyl carrier p
MKKFYVIVNGNKYEVEVEEVGEQREDNTPTETFNIDKDNLNEKKMEKKVTNSVANKELKGERVEAPMPGTIINVNIEEGDTVNKGQIIFTLEAMKMENEIMAPKDGKVLSVNVVKGSKVNTGDLLVILE